MFCKTTCGDVTTIIAQAWSTKEEFQKVPEAGSLMEEQSFPSACAELTQWCSDQRAFSSYFEDNLLAALQVAVENGTKDGFDFALAHQLISACFTHRKLLSKNSANRINRWYEQFRRLKKSGGKRKRKTEPSQPTAGPLPIDPSMETTVRLLVLHNLNFAYCLPLPHLRKDVPNPAIDSLEPLIHESRSIPSIALLIEDYISTSVKKRKMRQVQMLRDNSRESSNSNDHLKNCDGEERVAGKKITKAKEVKAMRFGN
ncbi:hypothetical protein TELCIR_02305 [Teladorsagia circumcincta]|uniref:ZMIZ1 N-terminal domain-containing protein n=1 Tax=Teladorsagia circumcincta TaxID=45464 RepID=A0A2G9UZS0_TELCI|nr:hypothetical protein TELCIR_02305 [Teladorsagia circumcincta]